MVVQFLSDSSLKAYIRYFTQLLKINDNPNVKIFLEQCKNELAKRQKDKNLFNCHKRDTSY